MRTVFFCIIILCILLTGNRLPGQESERDPAGLTRLIMDRKYKEAVEWGNLLLSRDSLNPQIHYYLGLAYSNLKQYRQACSSFETSDKLQPGNRSVLLNLADCYSEVADAGAAEVILTDLIKADSTDDFVWLELAQVYQRLSRIDEANAIYLRLWSADTTNIWFPRQAGTLLARNERYQEAIPLLETVVEADSTDQASFLRLGQAYIVLKTSDKIPVLDKAIRQDSMNPLLHRYRGGLWLMSGIFDLAEADLKRALELGDTTAFTCRHLGISQFQQSKHKEALPVLSLTVKIDSLDTEAWYYLGYCYKWTEDVPKAIECLEHALTVAIPPSAGSIYSGLGLFYNLRRDLKNAMINYEKALEYNPADAYPYSQLGLLTEQTSRDKEAAKAYYERFIREYTGGDKKLVEYVDYRIQVINEKLFMEGKLKKK